MTSSATLYARGSDNYNAIADAQGTAAADAAWQRAITAEMNQTPLDTSTFSLFTKQILSDPLAAPAASLNDQLKKLFGNIVKNPFVLLLVIAAIVAAFFYFGGAALLRKKSA